MAATVRIRRAVVEQMLQEARSARMMECCGLLAGRDGVITYIFPAENELKSAREFSIPPLHLFRVFHQMRAARLDHLGIYHSHPATPNEPSARDIDGAYYPDAAYFILAPQPNAERPVRAFFIREGIVEEAEIEIE
jgi:proteasome lid subunit RPN8/RPN11